ncbi:TRAP transporter large permease [Planococcus sp. 1R117A]|uniref:TRAP transporter large permease n=1 Tax=Planococcus sp. 1R117A TaxID=3447020 RepID=UPI003EDB77C2
MSVVGFILLFFVLVVVGIPIAFSFGISALLYLLLEMPNNLTILVSQSFSALDSFVLLAIPLFVFAGDVMKRGGISRTIVDFTYFFVKKIKGGLAHVTVIASGFFGAISGSSAATVAAIGGIMIPEMMKRGYDRKYAVAVSSAAGILGIIIPPSIPMIIYAMATNVSVARLFLAGIIPGLMLIVAFVIVNIFMESKYRTEEIPEEVVVETDKKKKKPWHAVPALFMPVLVLGGIYLGIFTPTEAGAVALIYGVIVGIFYYKELNFKNLMQTSRESAYTSALIMLIISMAGIFGWLITTQRIPELFTAFIMSITDEKFLILLILNIFYLILGSFLETITAILITTPIFLPLIVMLDIDLIHFGIIQTLNLAIGLITPPMALNLLVASRISGVPMLDAVKPLLPYLLATLIVLQLVTYVPEISLFLPNLLMGE